MWLSVHKETNRKNAKKCVAREAKKLSNLEKKTRQQIEYGVGIAARAESSICCKGNFFVNLLYHIHVYVSFPD